MKKISGFTFIHNALEGGYPLAEAIRVVSDYTDEIVAVDMQSTDGTREILLHKLGVRTLNGFWGNEAGKTLRQAHSLYRECRGDIIIHFEADEVYDPNLLENVHHLLQQGVEDIAVYRLQLEQNFQRCRWYPEPVHRVFPRVAVTRKDGHTTDRHDLATILGPENGYLWDITNCFRDNWMNRVQKQAELWNKEPQYIMTPIHSCLPADISKHDAQQWLYGGQHWEWTRTPFDIPEILKPLVGLTKYEASL